MLKKNLFEWKIGIIYVFIKRIMWFKFTWYKDTESKTSIEEIEISASVKQSPDQPHVKDADEDPQEDGGHQDEAELSCSALCIQSIVSTFISIQPCL